jgi:hypothetical protein
VPSGQITFINGAQSPTSAPVASDGTASLSTSFAVGTQSLKATYSGDSNFASSAATTILYSVQAASTDVIVGQSSPSTYGLPIQFSANVNAHSPGTNSPVAPCGGNVQFYLTTNLPAIKWGDPVPLSGASCGGTVYSPLTNVNFTALTVNGPNNITAQYYGTGLDPNFTDSAVSAPAMAHSVTPLAPTVTLVDATSTGSDYGASISLTANVTNAAGVPNTGSVNFTATPQGGATVTLGTVPLASGTATYLANPAPPFRAITTTFQANFVNTDPNFTNASSIIDSHIINRITPANVAFACARFTGTPTFIYAGIVQQPTTPPGLTVPTGLMRYTLQNLADLSVTTVDAPLDAAGNAALQAGSVAATIKITAQYVPDATSNYSGKTGTDVSGADLDPNSCIAYYP